MRSYRQHSSKMFSIVITTVLLISSQLVMAQGNSGGIANDNSNSNGNGKNKNIGVGNSSDGIMGSIITDKRIYYTGDQLEIGLRFARGSELIANGTVDAFVVIFSPNISDDASDSALTDAIVLPVSGEAGEETQILFELEAVNVTTLPAGTYQLGLILTEPEGDPLIINDWYNGLLGLVNIVGLTITDEAVAFDKDGDGQVDDDTDGDGFSDYDDSDDDDDDDGSTT